MRESIAARLLVVRSRAAYKRASGAPRSYCSSAFNILGASERSSTSELSHVRANNMVNFHAPEISSRSDRGGSVVGSGTIRVNSGTSRRRIRWGGQGAVALGRGAH